MVTGLSSIRDYNVTWHQGGNSIPVPSAKSASASDETFVCHDEQCADNCLHTNSLQNAATTITAGDDKELTNRGAATSVPGFDEVARAFHHPRKSANGAHWPRRPGRFQGKILLEKLLQLKPDPALATPLYLQLASKLTMAVHGGLWKPNEALPAERVLSEVLDVSRFTARKAIEILCDRGVLCRRHGSGTYVNNTLARPLSRLTGFSDEARQRGFEPGSQWLAREIGIAAKEECRALGLRANSPVSRLKRLRTADDQIVAIESATIPARYLPDPGAVDDSLYGYLAKRQSEPARARQHIQAVNADAELARLANVEPGAAMLYIRRIAYDAMGAAIELTHSYFRSDRFDFVAVLTQSPLLETAPN